MFEEYERVRIKKTGISGEIIDIYYPVSGEKNIPSRATQRAFPVDGVMLTVGNCSTLKLEQIIGL